MKLELTHRDVEEAVTEHVRKMFPGVGVTHVRFVREKGGPRVRAEVVVDTAPQTSNESNTSGTAALTPPVFEHNISPS